MKQPNDPSTNNRRILKFDDEEGASFLYGGTIIDNETFSGTNYFNWSIEVPNGITITIQSDANLYFASGKYLDVFGTLNAIGTSSNPITFNRSGVSGTWGGN